MHGDRLGATGADRSTNTRRGFLKGAAAAGIGGLTVGGSVSAAEGDAVPWLSRHENALVDPNGAKVVLRGVNTIDPKRAGGIEPVIDHATDASRGWYSRVIRLPMQPGDIGGHGSGPAPASAFTKDQLLSYLDRYVEPAVQHARANDVYIILDYHRHWPDGPDWNNETLFDEVQMFWETVAPRWAESSHVLYEMFNEPTEPIYGAIDSQGGVETWNAWREHAQPWVDTIRKNAPRNLVLIGSPQWSQFTYQAPNNEFSGDNLVYVGHIYAQESARPLSKYFGEPSTEVPVFMTEFGWSPWSNADYLHGTNETTGQEFMNFYDEYDTISWTAWCFDDAWAPAMLNADGGTANKYGQFIKDRLAAKRDADQPWNDNIIVPTETPTETATKTDTPTTTETPTSTPEGPTWPENATDPDGDGLYEDLSGNEQIGFPDVNMLFQNSDTANVRDNANFYDFEDSGTINLQDVMALFGEV
ncbi:MAG: glycoside hydrolase family 5 protein [Halococcoides sp.]